jgi:hypothetical protein
LVALGHLIVERVLRQWVSSVLLFLLASLVEIFISSSSSSRRKDSSQF